MDSIAAINRRRFLMRKRWLAALIVGLGWLAFTTVPALAMGKKPTHDKGKKSSSSVKSPGSKKSPSTSTYPSKSKSRY